MPKKKLLFINGHLNAGGCERSLVDLLQHLDYSSYQVDLLLLEGMGDYSAELPTEVQVHLYTLGRAFGPLGVCLKRAVVTRDWFSLRFRLIHLLSGYFGKRCLSLSRRLFPTCSGTYDAVIAFRQGICTDLAAYTFRGKKRISWWHHGEFIYESRQASGINQAFKRMDAVVAVSESCARLVREHFPLAERKVTVIPNMISVDRIAERAECPCDPAFPEGKFKIVSVARISPEKNFNLCVEAARELQHRGISFSWIIVGDGEQYKEIRDRIDSKGLSEHVRMVGRKINPYPWIKAADIMVHPSLVESQGISILEAMALSKPVIAVKSSGPMEFIESGLNGFLADDDPLQIADLILQIMNDADLAETLAREANQTARQYSPEWIACEVNKLFEQG